MYKLYKLFLLLALFIFSTAALAQEIKGEITDVLTGEVLPFVNITTDSKTTSGTVSDINGKFSLKITADATKIIFSYIGYDRKEIPIAEAKGFLYVKIEQSSTLLQDVVIIAGENPAHRIIKEAVKNRARNDFERLASYSYTSYNKFYGTLDPNSTIAQDSINAVKGKSKKRGKKLKKFVEKSHLFLTESVIEKKHLAPNFDEEQIIATRVSGMPASTLASIGPDYAPYNFYTDFVNMFDKEFLSPVSPGSTNRYDFMLDDTLLVGNDSIFVINFKPLAGRSFEALKGQIRIHSDGFAIQYITVEPAFKTASAFIIEQKYQLVNGRYWFPSQLNSELQFKEVKIYGMGSKMGGKSYYNNIQILPPLSPQDFGEAEINVKSSATKQPDSVWNTYRVDTLLAIEKNTYTTVDSVVNKTAAGKALKFGEYLLFSRIPVGPLDIDLTRLYAANRVEGHRLGFGLRTNTKFSKHLQLGSYVAYGTKDKRLKYGGEIGLDIGPRRSITMLISYMYDVYEPAPTYYPAVRSLFGSETYRGFIAQRMDALQELSTGIKFPILPFTTAKTTFVMAERKPLYAYEYAQDVPNDSLDNRRSFNYTEARLEFRYAKGEKNISMDGYRVNYSNGLPIFGLTITKGLRNIAGGNFDYTKLELAYRNIWKIRSFGKTEAVVFAGWTPDKLPYPLLFDGRGGNTGSPVLLRRYFQTMRINEFASSEYVTLFLSHKFGNLLFRNFIINPEIELIQNMGWGNLNNKSAHLGLTLKSMDKVYMEGGLMFHKLYRYNYLNILEAAIGAGAFYRYGAYTLPAPKDNLVFKISFAFTL